MAIISKPQICTEQFDMELLTLIILLTGSVYVVLPMCWTEFRLTCSKEFNSGGDPMGNTMVYFHFTDGEMASQKMQMPHTASHRS